jgi:hypothetical protein
VKIGVIGGYKRRRSSKHPVVHGVGVLNSVIGLIAEKRHLLFFGVAGVVFTTIRLILGANVFSIANMGSGMRCPQRNLWISLSGVSLGMHKIFLNAGVWQ